MPNAIVCGQIYKDRSYRNASQRVLRVVSEERDGRFACRVVLDADGLVPRFARWCVIGPTTLMRGYRLVEGKGEL